MWCNKLKMIFSEIFKWIYNILTVNRKVWLGKTQTCRIQSSMKNTYITHFVTRYCYCLDKIPKWVLKKFNFNSIRTIFHHSWIFFIKLYNVFVSSAIKQMKTLRTVSTVSSVLLFMLFRLLFSYMFYAEYLSVFSKLKVIVWVYQ